MSAGDPRKKRKTTKSLETIFLLAQMPREHFHPRSAVLTTTAKHARRGSERTKVLFPLLCSGLRRPLTWHTIFITFWFMISRAMQEKSQRCGIFDCDVKTTKRNESKTDEPASQKVFSGHSLSRSVWRDARAFAMHSSVVIHFGGIL
jgi:hypothetical protein